MQKYQDRAHDQNDSEDEFGWKGCRNHSYDHVKTNKMYRADTGADALRGRDLLHGRRLAEITSSRRRLHAQLASRVRYSCSKLLTDDPGARTVFDCVAFECGVPSPGADVPARFMASRYSGRRMLDIVIPSLDNVRKGVGNSAVGSCDALCVTVAVPFGWYGGGASPSSLSPSSRLMNVAVWFGRHAP